MSIMDPKVSRRVSTSRNTSGVASGQAPSKTPTKKKTGVASLKGKAMEAMKGIKRSTPGHRDY